MIDSTLVLVLVFGVQGILSLVDEFFFHRWRPLPRWERIGHPLDTLSLAGCVTFAAYVDTGTRSAWILLGGCAFSCLLVTKDEWVHSRLVGPAEGWIHALLFVIHPVVCFAVFGVWYAADPHGVLPPLAVILFSYAAYQFVYWNLLRKEPLASPDQPGLL